jgi:hypothetical protein
MESLNSFGILLSLQSRYGDILKLQKEHIDVDQPVDALFLLDPIQPWKQ